MSSLHIRLLPLMHKWVWVSLTVSRKGVKVRAWEEQVLSTCICGCAHVSLFKHGIPVICCCCSQGAEPNLVSFRAHRLSHLRGQKIRPRPRPPWSLPLSPPLPLHLCLSSVTSHFPQVWRNRCKRRPVTIQAVFLMQLCRSCNHTSNLGAVWATCSALFQ